MFLFLHYEHKIRLYITVIFDTMILEPCRRKVWPSVLLSCESVLIGVCSTSSKQKQTGAQQATNQDKARNSRFPAFAQRHKSVPLVENPGTDPNMSILAYALFAGGVLMALKLFDNWRKLRRAPGPLLASITDFWRAWHQYHGQLRGKLVDLHQIHGPIVRYGVRSISLSDPNAIDVIYGSRQGFTTVRHDTS